ncbi:vitamin K epoxide reductase family protein [Iningainema tapete]|uniref:Vitamin K epoxide reductase family protein n=1 Tax=Iningainema tapete BLCC-T55 TaxID=2748662 RepID=A0A8J7BWM3_9CYAN|nr:vitamin K epoxide reductase family protein [Iningainema tapete]MBD2772082.1 vitamin K epoxide reductase family protein [Iningainema tapete BLCC-T55]
MKRKSSIPWIHRWSRPLIAGIASLGAVVTAYLTFVKFTQGTTVCPTKGCDIVLASPYATVFGLPLALFGLIAYASMVVFAIAPLLVNSKAQKQLRSNLENWTGLLLFAGATAMLVFSSYLIYLLVFEIKAVCIYCVASALFSASLFILVILSRDWQDVGQLFFTAIVVGMIVLVGTLGVYAGVKNPEIANRAVPGEAGLRITTTSTEAEKALAAHLKQVGAKMYGAFWCPHCHDQKQLFGKEAFSQINYIECDPKGKNPQPDLCKAANVKGYPTWQVKAQTVSGTQSLEKLAQISGYKGSRNFKNSLPTP